MKYANSRHCSTPCAPRCKRACTVDNGWGVHWTSDAELLEDRRRLAWSRNPRGILVVAAVRMMALAILAVARRLTHMDYSKETPSWEQVAEHFLLVPVGALLDRRRERDAV